MNEIHAIISYFSLVIIIALASSSKKSDTADFFVGRRSMNYWLTALSAHASDMSSWLFMAFPAAIFTFGPFKAWVAVGLLLFMYLNWQFVAPKIRVATEKSNSLTFFSYLENRFNDKCLVLYCSLICFLFYAVYIASGLIGMGLLIEEIYGFPYEVALLGSISIVLLCVLIGGYRTLAWIDLFQGIFLLTVIVFVPLYILNQLGGWHSLKELILQKNISVEMFPKNWNFQTVFQMITMVLGWGLGYFGQPAIITKFMGIKHIHEINRAKYVGMIWMLLSLLAAVLVGLVAIGFFQKQPENSEMIFVEMVKSSFSPFFVGFILCSVFAATMNVISSQMLVIGSSFSENICKRFAKDTFKDSLLVTKMAMFVVSVIAFVIALYKVSSIYNLVLYAWSGLGCAFGPILIFSLYSKNSNKQIAWAAVIVGSLSSAVWPWVDLKFSTGIDPTVIGFVLSFAAIGISVFLQKFKPPLPAFQK